MSRSKLTTPALGAVALIGGGLFYSRRGKSSDATPPQSEVDRKKERANAKRDLGLGGAGVGGNAITGGTELASGLGSGNSKENPTRATQKPAGDVPRDQLPSGGVGGGYGGSNANSRSIELQKPGTPGTGTGTGTGTSAGEKLQGIFGTTGSRSEGPTTEKHGVDPKDTKVWSHHADTPTNRGGSPFDKHRRDVTAAAENPDRPG